MIGEYKSKSNFQVVEKCNSKEKNSHNEEIKKTNG
jgi:hypothetical protein